MLEVGGFYPPKSSHLQPEHSGCSLVEEVEVVVFPVFSLPTEVLKEFPEVEGVFLEVEEVSPEGEEPFEMV